MHNVCYIHQWYFLSILLWLYFLWGILSVDMQEYIDGAKVSEKLSSVQFFVWYTYQWHACLRILVKSLILYLASLYLASLCSSLLMTSFTPDQPLLQDDGSKPPPKRPKIENELLNVILCSVRGWISNVYALIKQSQYSCMDSSCAGEIVTCTCRWYSYYVDYKSTN